MDSGTDDKRGAGGKAPRRASKARTNTGNSSFFSILASPLTLAANAVSRVLPSPRIVRRLENTHDQPRQVSSAHQVAAAPAAKPTDEPIEQSADHAGPVMESAMPAATVDTTAIPAPVSASALEVVEDRTDAVAAQEAIPTSHPFEQQILHQKQTEGWSPRKIQSLSFFLKNNPGGHQQHTGQVSSSVENTNSSIVSDPTRPYLGLKFLLQSGPSSSSLPNTWASYQQGRISRFGVENLPGVSRPAINARLQQQGTRFQPYSLAAPPRPRQDDSNRILFNAAATPARTPAPAPLALTPPPAATPGAAGTPTLFTGVPSTQLPSLALAAQRTPRPGAVTRTPLMTPGTGKRQRDTGAGGATPLARSGIKNLAEYKRQRQRYAQNPSSTRKPLLGRTGAGAGDRSGSATPSLPDTVSQGSTPGQDSLAAFQALPAAQQQATDAAKRVLETLNQLAKSQDTPATSKKSGLAGVSGTPGPNSLNNPGGTPWPGARSGGGGAAPPPPLDRLVTPATAGGATPGASGRATGRRPDDNMPTPTALFPPLSPAANNTSSGGASDSQANTSGISPLVPQNLIVATPTDVLTGLKPAKHKTHEKSKSVRFNVPDESILGNGNAGPALKAAEASNATAAGVANGFSFGKSTSFSAHVHQQQHNEAGGGSSSAAKVTDVPTYTFGASVDDQVRQVCESARDLDPSAAPTFTFGSGTTGQQKQLQSAVPAFLRSPAPSTEEAKALHKQVTEASSVPLPDDDEEEDAQPAPATVATGGWSLDFLAKNQASAAAATDAIAQEVDKLKNPAGGLIADSTAKKDQDNSSSAAAPVATAGGWPAHLLAANAAANAKAQEDIQKEIEKTKQPAAAASTGIFNFGASVASSAAAATTSSAPLSFSFGAASSTQAKTTEQVGATVAAATTTAPKETAAPAAASGWPAEFLQKSQAALDTASKAAQEEAEKLKSGGTAASTQVTPAASPAPSFAFGMASNKDTPSATPAASPALSFTFGATAAKADAATPAADSSKPAAGPSPAFGMFSPAPGAAFGANTAAAEQPKPSDQSSAWAAAFGTPTAATPSAFGASVNASTPGVSPGGALFGGSAATPMPSQGANSSSAATSLFSPAPALATSSVSPAPAATSAPAFSFGAASPAPAVASSPAFSFGAAAASQPAASTGFAFGGASATPAPAAASASNQAPFMFGSTTTTTSAPASNPAPFGGFSPAPTTNAATSTTSASPFPAFGAVNTTTTQAPAFGTNNATTSSNPFGAASNAFGSPAPTAASPSGFAFGGAAATPAPASQPSVSFGQAQTNVFGTPTPQAAANTFGNPGSTPFNFGGAAPSPNASPMFGFGGAAQQSMSPSPASAFGGFATPPTLSSTPNQPANTGFAFGGAQAPMQQPAFGTPGAAPAAFGAAPAAAAPASPGGGGGFGMSLNDMGKSGDGGRRKVRARRTGQ